MINYNIKQVTGYDITEHTPTVRRSVLVPERYKQKDGTYIIRDIYEDVNYRTILSNVQILKLGYCCENKGIIYPIFLQMNGTYKEIKVGRDGMYEMQPESWMNVNNKETEEKTTDVIITGVQVPDNINFTLEYVLGIN